MACTTFHAGAFIALVDTPDGVYYVCQKGSVWWDRHHRYQYFPNWES